MGVPPRGERLEPLERLADPRQDLVGRGAGEGVEPLALQQLQDQEGAAVRGEAGVEDRRQAGMAIPASDDASFSNSGAPAASRDGEATVISFTATVRPDCASAARRTVPKRVDFRIFSS